MKANSFYTLTGFSGTEEIQCTSQQSLRGGALAGYDGNMRAT